MSAEKAREKKKRDREVKNRIKNLSKEALAASLAKKQECSARAMRIVEQSIEPFVEEPWLLENLKHINQTHFQDIVVERAITKICGYPLCVEELSNVPRKMYKISTRENKVYDITDRKNYCSNNCYKAGNFLKEQLYTSPLWLRDCEVPVEFEILTPAVAVKESGVGAEVDLGNTKPVQLDANSLKELTQEVPERPIKEADILKHKPAHSAEVAMDINKTESETKTDSCIRSPGVSSVTSTDSSHYSTADEEFTIAGSDKVNSLINYDNERKINTEGTVSSSDQEKALPKDIPLSTLPADTLEAKLETPKALLADTLEAKLETPKTLPADTLEAKLETPKTLPADTLEAKLETPKTLPADTLEAKLETPKTLPADTLEAKLETPKALPADTLEAKLETPKTLPADTLEAKLETPKTLPADTLEAKLETPKTLPADTLEAKLETPKTLPADTLEAKLETPKTLPADTLEAKLETPKIKACRKKQRKGQPSTDIVKGIEKRIESWFTLETMAYVLGKEKLKELLKISGYVQDLLSKKGTRKTSSVEEYHFFLKCQEIKKRINIIELQDQVKQKPKKPVPDYNELKKDANELLVIVRNFFRGDTKVSFADEDKNDDDDDDGDDENAPVLPLIHHYSAASARRRIVMDRLNKALPDIQSALELSNFPLCSDLEEIVATFNLTPTNITMRPAEWTLISVVIIKLLTLRNEILEYAFSRPITQKRLMPYLLSYDLDGGYLERFISYLMDVDRVASLIPIE